MRDWPPIDEPELLERLALDDERFRAFFQGLAAAWPRREYDPATFAHARGYPWERPRGSYVLDGEDVRLLGELGPARRAETVSAFVGDRHPLVAFGANASPARLALKFAHLAAADDRRALVVTGELHDLDVGAIATAPLLGYVPGSLIASPGTAVAAAVVWATPAQVTQLTWSEMTYRLGRLDEARFEAADVDLEVDALFAFVSRLGAFCVDGAPVALAAVPARDRSATALTQPELLDAIAALVLGPGADAEALARASCADMGAVMARAAETLWPAGRQLTARWTPFPAGTPT